MVYFYINKHMYCTVANLNDHQKVVAVENLV